MMNYSHFSAQPEYDTQFWNMARGNVTQDNYLSRRTGTQTTDRALRDQGMGRKAGRNHCPYLRAVMQNRILQDI